MQKPPKINRNGSIFTAHHFPMGTTFSIRGSDKIYTVHHLNIRDRGFGIKIRSENLGILNFGLHETDIRSVDKIFKRGDGPLLINPYFRNRNYSVNASFIKWHYTEKDNLRYVSYPALFFRIYQEIDHLDHNWYNGIGYECIDNQHVMYALLKETWFKVIDLGSWSGHEGYAFPVKKLKRFIRQNWRRWLRPAKETQADLEAPYNDFEGDELNHLLEI